MKLLLDTHVVLWAQRDSARLSSTARTLLAEPSNDVLLSAVVPWELSIKEHAGKLPEAAPLLTAWREVVRALAAVPLPMVDDHALAAGRLDWTHKDPFDRMLAAQAVATGATVVSADTVFDTFPAVTRLW
ncbi:MAG: type II toxin-antitoxin system VapC family toxin [Micrococcales bacterium]|nr:type II toxin-antitoxin system VapC family toxin [Micrococcales bacterium]